MPVQRHHQNLQPAHVRRARYVSFKMRPLTLLFSSIAALTVCGWAGVVTTYAFFRDDVLIELVSRQQSMDRSYKDTINTLRAEVDTLQSKRMVERATFSDRLELLHKQQAVLEQRHTALTSLVGLPSPMAALEQENDDNLTTGVIPSRSKPKPMGSSVGTEPMGGAEDGIGLRGKSSFYNPKRDANPNADLSELETRFARLINAQDGTTEKLSKRYINLRDVYADVYKSLGMSRPAAKTAAASSDNNPMGGPFIPLPSAKNGGFGNVLQKAVAAREEAVNLRNGLRGLPLQNPAPDADYTSSFGVRNDPFLGTPAFHSGIDFRVKTGTPIHATASGTVVTAGWSGGYGNLVELEHTGGYSTRYGHLESVRVNKGDTVRAGDVVGYSGSTGRSTGPHLHYETRINDQAVNPERFLKVSEKLEGLL